VTASASNGEGSADLTAAIHDLEHAIQAIGRGELGTRVTVSFGEDHPMGAMATAINEMCDALMKSRRARIDQEEELQRRIGTIQAQREAIVELSTPVIEVWQGVLTLPVLGMVDAERSTRMTRELLEAVSSVKAKLAIIDVTGMDAATVEVCDHLLRMARCVELLGARCALSGMRPQVARALVEAGSDLSEVASFPNLRAALAAYVAAKDGAITSRRRS